MRIRGFDRHGDAENTRYTPAPPVLGQASTTRVGMQGPPGRCRCKREVAPGRLRYGILYIMGWASISTISARWTRPRLYYMQALDGVETRTIGDHHLRDVGSSSVILLYPGL